MKTLALKFFTLVSFLGGVIMVGTIVALFHGDIYKEGNIGGQWFLSQFSGSALMMYSGIFGVITCVANKENAKQYAMLGFWVPMIALILMFGASFTLALHFQQVETTGTWVDGVVSFVGWATNCVAILTAFVATYYGFRVHTLRGRGRVN